MTEDFEGFVARVVKGDAPDVVEKATSDAVDKVELGVLVGEGEVFDGVAFVGMEELDGVEVDEAVVAIGNK